MAKTVEEDIISARIRERMDALGLSHADVASGCGVSEMSVRNWRLRAMKMNAQHLRPLARTLKCSMEYLTGESATLGRPPK